MSRIEQEVEMFRDNLRDCSKFSQMFEYLPDVIFYVKDAKCRIMMCNNTFLRYQGARDLSAVLGKTSYDFFPKALADTFILDDKKVMESKKPLVDRVELTIDGGEVAWFSTTKLPVFDK